jgi:hypothetical protein
MSKAEDYIVENMESGLITGWDDKNRPICQSLLTPDQARKAVEIAREETIKEVCEWLDNHTMLSGKWYIEDLKKHLEGKK